MAKGRGVEGDEQCVHTALRYPLQQQIIGHKLFTHDED